MGWKKGGVIGLIIGAVLALINSFLLFGTLGAMFYAPFSNIFESSVCAGEGCWLWLIIIGDIGYLLFGFVIGAIIGKLKSK